MTDDAPHIPVLLDEVLDALDLKDGDTLVDCTFGAGGYSRAALASADVNVIGIDRDPDAFSAGQAMASEFEGRLTLINGAFGDLADLLRAEGIEEVQKIVMDIGVSSMQLDQAGRGFAFMQDGPLDMTMAQGGITAADLVNKADEKTLADLIFQYGEDRASRRIAKAMVRARQAKPIDTTLALVDVIVDAVGKGKHGAIHPATRSFQALRIAVNDELGELGRALRAAEQMLAPGGILVVVTFHSLEDRIVKRFFGACAKPGAKATSRHQPMVDHAAIDPSFDLLTRKPVAASGEEIARNPRSRSAKLRAARRTDAAAIAPDFAAMGVPALAGDPARLLERV